ncbi:MAG: EF-hand domain-containing protein [Novosphingobium sp.]|uniref:EF-hand domain-containing protein n=1 Tax=Novosphingobium sp. TaxID=1874826 RepID=UPI003C79C1DA
MKTKILGLSLAALGLAGAAYAAAPQAPADALGDKTVTKAEFIAKHGEMFDKMDANRDGKLDAADRTAHMGQMFDMADSDHNGSLSRAEFGAMHQRGPGGDMAPGKGMGKGMGHGGDHGMGMKMLGMADANHDGAVTRDEFLAGAGQHFDMMDANHDGSLTKAERAAARAKMGGGKHRAGRGGHGGQPMGDHPMGDMPPPPPPAN